jgi:hypothetical protein
MLPTEKDFLARKEYFGQLRLEAEHEQLVKLAKLQQEQNTSQKLLGWIGGQLIQWGLKLQQDKLSRVQNPTELAENTD